MTKDKLRQKRRIKENIPELMAKWRDTRRVAEQARLRADRLRQLDVSTLPTTISLVKSTRTTKSLDKTIDLIDDDDDDDDEDNNRQIVLVKRTRPPAQTGGAYTSGLYVEKGMRDAKLRFEADELEYLDKRVANIKTVDQLRTEHIHYLVAYKLMQDLKEIQAGHIESQFHDRFHELDGMDKSALRSEIRTSLFTSEQTDYLSGLLQGLFDANKETLVRIVMYINGFSSLEETLSYMKVKSKEYYSNTN